jgi:hypothetical protein
MRIAVGVLALVLIAGAWATGRKARRSLYTAREIMRQ